MREKIKLSARIQKLRALEEERAEKDAALEYQIKENKRLQERCHDLFDMYARQRQSKECFKDDVWNMERRVEELTEKLEKSKQNPLLLIRVAVRKRFLEQAKGTVPLGEDGSENDFEDDIDNARDLHPKNLSKEEAAKSGNPDRVVIEKGNIAAHRGNSEADAALFDAEYMDTIGYEQLYKATYHMDPRRLGDGYYSARLTKIHNCEATILALVTVSNPAEGRKQPVLDRLAGLSKAVRFDESEYGEYEDDVKLDRYVEEAEKMTAEFVEKYRRR